MGRLLYGSVVGLMATSSKRAYATRCVTQVCCTQSPCLCGRPLLTHTSAGDTQTLKGRSGSVSVGSLGTDVQKSLVEPSKCLWQVWGLILNAISPLLPSCWGFFFALGWEVCFFVRSNILLSLGVQQEDSIMEVSQEEMSTCPSTPPSCFPPGNLILEASGI